MMKERTIRTVVIGSGCAGLNASDWLAALGETDVAIVTENLLSGTSRNTGSDKQTYYKLSLAGDDGDSVGDMAQTLLRSDVHGDTALCEAANSARCFMKLASLGVPFPMNEYGEYVGYQTDHDVRRRATSAGPLTSRFMTEALERSVKARGVELLDHVLAFRILTDERGVTGLLCLDTAQREWLLIRCVHIVLCTGGPAMIYRNSVYPESQCGMSGMAFAAGAAGANLDCWQYGLASVKFRWNVSGSYQQALPRYVSVDADGVEREFLSEALGAAEAMDRTFLKGYQWPFDPRKADRPMWTFWSRPRRTQAAACTWIICTTPPAIGWMPCPRRRGATSSTVAQIRRCPSTACGPSTPRPSSCTAAMASTWHRSCWRYACAPSTTMAASRWTPTGRPACRDCMCAGRPPAPLAAIGRAGRRSTAPRSAPCARQSTSHTAAPARQATRPLPRCPPCPQETQRRSSAACRET